MVKRRLSPRHDTKHFGKSSDPSLEQCAQPTNGVSKQGSPSPWPPHELSWSDSSSLHPWLLHHLWLFLTLSHQHHQADKTGSDHGPHCLSALWPMVFPQVASRTAPSPSSNPAHLHQQVGLMSFLSIWAGLGLAYNQKHVAQVSHLVSQAGS